MDKREKKTLSGRQVRLPFKRRLVQLYCGLLYNAQVKGFVTGRIYDGRTKAACVPGLNCYSCPGAVGACPLGAVQNALAQSRNRAGFYVLGIILLYGLILGRTICGWMCPMGLIQELLHMIPTPKIRKSRITRALTYLKYVILAVFAAAIPLWFGLRHGLPVPGFCKYICPAGTLEGSAGLLSSPANRGLFGMLGLLFTRKLLIMLATGLACVFCYRAFCRFLCPLGAIYGMFSRLALVGVKVDLDRCTGCGACVRSCMMDVKRVGDHECIHCAECMAVCPERAISVKAGSVTLAAPEYAETDPAGIGTAPAGSGKSVAPGSAAARKLRRGSVIVRGAALFVLCFALLWYNVLRPSGSAAAVNAAGSASVTGHAPGETLPDFTALCLDGSVFSPGENRGKPVFINLWATYCGPCIEELPYFNELYRRHGDDIAVLAVHSSVTVEDVSEYLKDKGWEFPFTVDEGDAILSVIGGSLTMPQTVVLDREGRVVYNEVRSVTPELLEKLYQEAAGQDKGGI